MENKIENLARAKSGLIVEHPFFASILLSLPMVENNSIPTMGTNGEKIVYNRKFVDSLTLSETTFVLAHETLHCVFMHMYRRGNRDKARWNIAADYIINDLLVNEKIGIAPKGALINPALVKAGKGTSEGVYELLPESDKDKKPGDIDAGGSLDEIMDASDDPAEMSERESQMKVRVIQASNAAKMCGKMSAGLERLVGQMTKPKVDWKSVLRRFLSEKAKTDLSYSKPKRRWLAEDIYLPSLTGEKMGAIVVPVDCSGSIDEKLLNEFATEIKAIVADVSPMAVHVIYFDSEVLKTETFGPDDAVELRPVGGGGTAFSPIFRHIEEKDYYPVACVVLTDLCCSDFGPSPTYPVLWASTEKTDQVPFGEVVFLRP